MLDLNRLDPHRLRRVALSLRDARDDHAFARTLHPRVHEALAEAVDAGAALGRVHSVPPIAVDDAADATFAALFNAVSALESNAPGRVVAPSPAAAAASRAAGTLRLRAFPQGIQFVTRSMPLQHQEMVRVVERLRRDEVCAAAVEALHLGWLVEHMEAHLAPYGRVVERADRHDERAHAAAFHAALSKLARRAVDHHEGDDVARARLLGAYETELAAQRAADSASRKRRRKETAPG